MNLVTLYDGQVVDSSSEAWRAECEARAVLAMPTKADRLNYLNGWREFDGTLQSRVLQRRGPEAVEKLRALMLALWQAGRAAV